jgi:hypothetical protein
VGIPSKSNEEDPLTHLDAVEGQFLEAHALLFVDSLRSLLLNELMYRHVQ